MVEKKEWERINIEIDREMEVDDENNHQINFYMETWFDVDKKFHLDINDEDGTWLNMYGKYDPYADTLKIECEISREEGNNSFFDYEPTDNETKLIKDMVREKIQQEHHQTPREFCDSFANEEQILDEQTLGG